MVEVRFEVGGKKGEILGTWEGYCGAKLEGTFGGQDGFERVH